MNKLDDGENVSPEVRKMVDENFGKLLMSTQSNAELSIEEKTFNLMMLNMKPSERKIIYAAIARDR